jgi:putative flavoprotein involved in K+ transport
LPPGPVLVVGGGNSGFQIAGELAATRQVDLSIATKAPVLPQRLAGKDLFWWLTRLGLMRVTAGSRLGRRLRARPDFIIGSSRRRLRAAGVRFRPAVAGAEGRTVRFADGSSLDAGIVIWTTGYRPDYSWIHIPGVAGDGHLIHRRGVTDVPGLYFLGLPWQHRRGSSLLGFVHEDAAYLAGHVTSRAPARQPAARPASQQPG